MGREGIKRFEILEGEGGGVGSACVLKLRRAQANRAAERGSSVMQAQLASAGAVQLPAARPRGRSGTSSYSRDAGFVQRGRSMDIICVLRMFPQALRRNAQSGPAASWLARPRAAAPSPRDRPPYRISIEHRVVLWARVEMRVNFRPPVTLMRAVWRPDTLSLERAVAGRWSRGASNAGGRRLAGGAPRIRARTGG
jgi:hypothetical protein